MLTTSATNSILRAIVGLEIFSGSSAYVGLSSTAPNKDGTNITEPTGNGYRRVPIGAIGHSNFTPFRDDPVDGTITNTKEVYFPESTGSWGAALTHFVIFHSEDGTNADDVIAFNALKESGVASPVTVSGANTVVMFRPGTLTVTLNDETA